MFGGLKYKQEGWLAVSIEGDRIDFAHVARRPGQRPALTKLESYGAQGGTAQALAALGKQKIWRQFRCTALLKSGNYQINQLDAPDVPETEWREALRWRLKDFVDFPVDACSLDVVRIPMQNLAGRPQPVFVVSAGNAVLAPLIRSFDTAKFELAAIDIPEMAQRNIAALLEEENRGLAFLTFDSNGGTLTFTFRSELYVARRIEVTSGQIEGADEDRKRQLFERVGLELQRSMDNFERLYNFISVSRVVLGPSVFAASLVDFLHDYVYVPVRVMDLTEVLDCSAVPEIRQPALQAERLSIIGAALRDEAGAP